ncbi:MAG: epoxyqueuosine reductase QueH [Candidatus Margulisbacteria bacterium]|nr:epoxyqueuosine reductase QueH [Candidatus Margulisiibacteriota bacterium]
MRFLLNVCCAPCALPLIEAADRPVLFFYGPNIYPREEYDKRSKETEKIAGISSLDFLAGEYEHDNWLRYVTSQLLNLPETYQEGGERCQACFKFRLAGTARFAKENGFERFATTLSVSRFKDVSFINRYGVELAEQHGLEYVTFQIDAGEAHRRGIELSRLHGIYRQKYCGCEFGLR